MVVGPTQSIQVIDQGPSESTFSLVHLNLYLNPTKNLNWKLGLDFLDYLYLKILIYRMDIQSIKYIRFKLDW